MNKKKIKLNISKEHHGNDLESLGNIFRPIIKDVISAEDLVQIDILLNWKYIVGEQMAAFCFPVKAKYNPRENVRTLFVEVPAGGYALELQHREEQVLEKINSYFGYKAVHKLNISQNIKRKPVAGQKNREKDVSKDKKIDESEKQWLKAAVQDIKDEKLKEILIKLGESIILSNQKGERL